MDPITFGKKKTHRTQRRNALINLNLVVESYDCVLQDNVSLLHAVQLDPSTNVLGQKACPLSSALFFCVSKRQACTTIQQTAESCHLQFYHSPGLTIFFGLSVQLSLLYLVFFWLLQVLSGPLLCYSSSSLGRDPPINTGTLAFTCCPLLSCKHEGELCKSAGGKEEQHLWTWWGLLMMTFCWHIRCLTVSVTDNGLAWHKG